MSSSITIAARMNGPLPPDLGMGGVVSDIRALHFRHQQIENRRLSAPDYSYPTDRARVFLRGELGVSGRYFDKAEDRHRGIAPTARVGRRKRRAGFLDRWGACRMFQHEPSGRSEQG